MRSCSSTATAFGAFHPFRHSGPEPNDVRSLKRQSIVSSALATPAIASSIAQPRSCGVDDFNACSTQTRAHVRFALEHGGEQVLANVLHVAELARRYEADGGISFRGFIEELREQAEDGQAGEAPILEEGSDGVRMMTVHKAKGLEFPVVDPCRHHRQAAAVRREPLSRSRRATPARFAWPAVRRSI